jgi:cytoskeletal protein RodZ
MKTIGQAFAEERKRQNLTLTEVSKATKIREDFLRAIEKGDFKALPSSAYAYGFVRNYAKYLGLPVEKSLALYRREFDEKKNIEVLPRGFSNPKEYVPPKFRFGRTALALGILFVIIAGFLVFQYRAAVFDPGIDIDSPKNNQRVNSLTVEVEGKTDPASTLTIDNKVIPISSDGEFQTEITLFPGESTITFRVENRFGRVTTEERKVIVKPN